ncbi:ras-related protein Ral-A [Leptopilina heterotoma]|uniref:ras-related protein Ral-A n=1 Tax=Leptopilina heterotoma TaxID=63436 RepID=UPI001CA98541|nr:ras-related protein Ral-A [Leptopilina heterotoma]
MKGNKQYEWFKKTSTAVLSNDPCHRDTVSCTSLTISGHVQVGYLEKNLNITIILTATRGAAAPKGVKKFYFLSATNTESTAKDLIFVFIIATKTVGAWRRKSLQPQRQCQLDLDYLERGGDIWRLEVTDSTSREEENSSDSLEQVKIIFLGAPGVGKSSIVKQFVWSEFNQDYRPTEKKETYYQSVVLADRLYEIKITDIPTIPYFPINTQLEWTDFRYYGLRSATAYVLVFDLNNQDTFQYIRMLREQIYEARDMRGVPLLVVGNKQDKLTAPAAPGTRHRDIVNLVRKHWRCGYVECSAKYNCRIIQVFREIMKSIQAVEGKPPSPTPTASQTMRANQQNVHDKCVIL